MLTIVNYNKDEYNFPALLVLGCFDAIHIGHEELLKKAKLQAKINGLDLGVMMFNAGKGGKQLYTFEERCAFLEKYNVKFVLNIDFTEDFKKTTAAQFLENVEKSINVKGYMSGKDFRFGAGAKGKSATLKKYADDEDNAVWYMPVKDVLSEGEKVSTTLIKECLEQGAINRATQLLGREYSVKGTVCDGHERGTMMGIPTANIVYPENKSEVKQGVYGVDVSFDGNTYKGVANYGGRPTFGEDSPVLETYIVDYSGDLYGKEITVSFKNYIRAIRKFDDAEALTAQIHADISRIGEPDSTSEDEPLDTEAITAGIAEPITTEEPVITEEAVVTEEPVVTEPVEAEVEPVTTEEPAPEEAVAEEPVVAEEVAAEPAEEPVAEAAEPVEEPVTEEVAVEESEPVEEAEEPAEEAEPVAEPAEEVTEEVTEEPAVTEEVAEEPVVTEDATTEEEPVTEEVTEETTEETAEPEITVEEVVAEEIPAEEIPAEEIPAEETTEEAPIEETTEPEITAEEVVAEEVSPETPAEEVTEEVAETAEPVTEEVTTEEPVVTEEIAEEPAPVEESATEEIAPVEEAPAEETAEEPAEEVAETPAEPERELTPEELAELEFEREFALLLAEEERENAEKAAKAAKENGEDND